MARYYNLGAYDSEHIRDRLVVGMTNDEMSQKLQMEQYYLTIEKAADTARHWELVKTQNASTVDAAACGGKSEQLQRHDMSPSRHDQRMPTENSHNKCWHCGYKQISTRDVACPASGKECR